MVNEAIASIFVFTLVVSVFLVVNTLAQSEDVLVSGEEGASKGGFAASTDKPETTTIIYGPKGAPQIWLDKYKAHCGNVGGVFNDCGAFCTGSETGACFRECDSIKCDSVPVKESGEQSDFKMKEKEGKYEIEYRTEDSKYKIKYAEGKDYEFESEVEIENVFEDEIKIKRSGGSEDSVKVLPDEAVRKTFGSEVGDVTVKLEEKSYNNVPRVVYKINGDSPGRFLGIFKIKAKYEAEVDATTGNVLDWDGPWWAFLITGGIEKPIIEDEIKVDDDSPVAVEDESKIIDFSSCSAAGYPVMESYPKQCMYKDMIFVDFENVDDEQSCTSVKGLWLQGMSGEWFCNKLVSDGGKSCTDSKECESQSCIPPSSSKPGQTGVIGTCYQYRSYFPAPCPMYLLEEGIVPEVGSCY